MSGKKLERRAFIQTCGVVALGGSFLFNAKSLFALESDKKKNTPFNLSKPKWIIYENGTYDLISKEIILKNCRPAINGQGVMPKNVFLGDSPKGKRIVYELSDGFLMLDLKTNKDSISIGAELSGFSYAPRWFFPISQAEVFGVKRFLRQSFGSGGESGVLEIVKTGDKKLDGSVKETSWSYDSYLTFAFLGDEETIAIGNVDQNDFLQRSAIYNRPYRTGLHNEEVDVEQIFFESGILLEETDIENEYIKLPELQFFTGNKPFETLQELTWDSGEVTKARQSSVTSFHWLTEETDKNRNSFEVLQKQIEYLHSLNPKLPLQTLVINKGYCEIGDWLEFGDNWPGGYDRAAREIFKEGYRAGIWLAPFVVSEKSKLFNQHRDWLLYDYNNAPIKKPVEGEESCYVLDISQLSVRRYLQRVFKTLRKAGFIFYKTDYMDWGLTGSRKFKETAGNTSVQVFREVLQLIRDEIGVGSLWMMGDVPYSTAIGYADILRTGIPANNTESLGRVFRESYFTHYFNNIYWQNNHCGIDFSNLNNRFSEDEFISMSLWQSILGGAFEITGDISAWDETRLKFLRFLEPAKRQHNATLPFWPDPDEIKVAVRYYKQENSWAVLFLNDKKVSVNKTFQISDLIEKESAFVFNWKPEIPIPFGNLTEIKIVLDPFHSRLFYLSEKEALPPGDLTLGGKNSEGL